jgi:L-cysteine/cystine lyase
VVGPFLPDDAKLAAVRAGLPALAAGIYLNAGSVGPLPAETALAMAELAERELTVGRAHPADWPDALARIDEARAAVAAVLTTDVDRIALTGSATHGLNLAAWSIDWRSGDRVLTTGHEHAGGVGPLYVLRDRFGVEVVFVDIGNGSDDDATVAAFERALTPRTRMIALSHVVHTTGALLPIRRIADLAHAGGALIAVDGAQAAGAVPVDVVDLGVDLYAVTGQKWLLGPEGTGALFVARAADGRVAMSAAGWHAYEQIDSAGTAVPHGDARRFQSSGFNRPSVLGLARSIGWLTMYVGLDWIHRRGPTLAAAGADRLAAIPGVRLLTPRERMATLVTFTIDGWPAEAVVDELGARTFAIVRTIPDLDATRLSIGFFNTDDEIERVVRTVELLATHKPDSLPPRRTLAMLGSDS